MPLSSLGVCLWWPLAKLGLCLAGVDDDELYRLRRQGLRWMVLLGGAVAALVVLSGSVLAGARSAPPFTSAGPDLEKVAIGGYIAAAVLVLPLLALWWYVRAMVRRAVRDRESVPEVCRGTVRLIIRPRGGGWPVLIRRTNGRGRWVTGSTRTLAPIRGRLTGRAPRRPFQLSVTLTYYRRSRVIKEIGGVVVEDLAAAWARTGVPAIDAI
jgi:hypothetical protein